MATLFTVEAVLEHSTFAQGRPTGPGGLAAPLGVASAYARLVRDTAATSFTNDLSVAVSGASALVYTLGSASIRVVYDDSSDAALEAFEAGLAARYQAWPILGDLDSRTRWGSGVGPQSWAMPPTRSRVLRMGSLATVDGVEWVLEPARSPNHPGDWPTIAGREAGSYLPRIDLTCGTITAAAASREVIFEVSLQFLYWAPRSRLAPGAYAALPVRGT